jgi:hypothetical protein
MTVVGSTGRLPTTITMVDTEDESDDPLDSEWSVALDWLPVDLRTQTEASRSIQPSRGKVEQRHEADLWPLFSIGILQSPH